MWANFQNPHPNYIYYNLHREKQWRPYIYDSDFKKTGHNSKKEKSDKSNSSNSSGKN